MLSQPTFNWEAPDRYLELLKFEVELVNVLQARAYDLNNEEKVSIIKNWLGREGLQFIDCHQYLERGQLLVSGTTKKSSLCAAKATDRRVGMVTEAVNYLLIRLLSLFVSIMNKTGTAVNKVKSLLKSWQAFTGFHTEATSSGH